MSRLHVPLAALAVATAAAPAIPAPTFAGGSWLAAQELLLVGGHVVDVDAKVVRTESLLIRDGVIVGSPAGIPDGFAGEVRDISGRWVIPALVDLHTHSFGNQAPVEGGMEFLGTPEAANRMLYAGVGAFLDLFSLEDQIFFARNAQRENRSGGADIHAAGPCMTAPGGHCSEYGIPTRLMSTPEEARRQVAELAAKDPDVVKVVYAPGGRMPSVDRATMSAAIETASQLGIPTVIHVQEWDDVRHAAIAGASGVTHVPGDSVAPDDVIALMLEHGTASIPTLAVHLGVSDLTARPELLDTPLARTTAVEAIRSAYRGTAITEAAERWREAQVRHRPAILESVRRLHDAGVPVLVGTDSGNLGTIQGWSVHHELMLLVEAGLDEWAALAAGSTRAAAFLGRKYGVRPGARADLVILEASPLEDIANTQRIADVIHAGAVMERRAPVADGGPAGG